jgi:hypothetical protein
VSVLPLNQAVLRRTHIAVQPRGEIRVAADDPIKRHHIGRGDSVRNLDKIPEHESGVAVRHFRVDEEGKILGQGHPKRDAVAWMFPFLWPIDLVRLPARGPRPSLSGEVPVVLRLMDDVDVPCSSYPSCRGASPMAFEPRRFQPARH